SESTGRDPKTKELHFSICCNQGLIKLPPLRQPPPLLEKLLQYIQFCETIRVYNALLAFTSIGAKLDYSVVFGRGSFTFRIQGQTYHHIGSLIPKPKMMDANNCLAKVFRRVRERYEANSEQDFTVSYLIKGMANNMTYLNQMRRYEMIIRYT
ncbi:unnamed protein product, partial [Brassica rapa subsp. narinosa]